MNMTTGPAAIKSNFSHKDIVSLSQFDRESVLLLFERVKKIKKTPAKQLLKILTGKIIALLFFEPSTRTFSSHSAAVQRLGGGTIDHQNPMQTSSVIKGESIEDTISMIQQYSDAIVIRHPIVGTAEKCACVSDIPIINAGDGIGEHPTQALLDMLTIFEKHERLDNLKGLMVGDLLNGRTIHSLLKGLSIFKNNTAYLLAPKSLRLSKKDFNEFTNKGVKLMEIQSFKDIPKDCDFWYWTRVQKERFKDKHEYEKLKLSFILDKKLVDEKAGKNTLLMHPLPRVGEIKTDVDSDPRAVYLSTQAKNGVYVRMALLSLIIGNRG